MKQKCLFCLDEFEAKRKSAKFCSSKCRVYSSRIDEQPTASLAPKETSERAFKEAEKVLVLPPKKANTPREPKKGSFRDFLKNGGN